jgi:uncharacterized membrane protein
MSDRDLRRLEDQIGRLLRLGVLLSAIAMSVGLALSFAGVRTGADLSLQAGLMLLIAIPFGRILASFVDSLRRNDRLLTISTGIVLVILVSTFVSSYFRN